MYILAIKDLITLALTMNLHVIFRNLPGTLYRSGGAEFELI